MTALIEDIRRFYLRHGRRGPIPYGIGCAYARDAAVHRAAYGSGIRYFDTSYNYGKGESEEVLGQFVAGTDRRTVFIATKAIVVPVRLSGPEAAALVRASLEASLGRLRTGYIDLYQLHETTSLHQAFGEDGILQMLQAARREGLIRYIGIGTASHEVLGEAAASGAFDSILTYGDYTPLEQSAETLIREAAASGVCVVNGSPLAGRLISRDDPRSLALTEDDHRRRRLPAAVAYRSWCARSGVDPVGFALQFPLGSPDIALNLFGPASLDQLEENLDLLAESFEQQAYDSWLRWYRAWSDGGRSGPKARREEGSDHALS
ncbi:aldo/keto reductase [Cohnella hashimotonis]|uniref:Aldo/keto reductase n=1 Tax=Cohnella hashimotonis TaxID=2826895 RepID=A0ABT6TMC6_9BACL|nr:aldo/keto reductase [Cohnella hashimotonis]